ncbi:MAG: PKD domain-containing protein, partial [Bacteroidota bacterium]
MMKFIINKKYIFKIALFVLAILSVTNISHASNDINYVVISGQIINMEYGNPVEGHEVIIESDSTRGGLNGYYNILLTNYEGYYYDTVYTDETKGSFVVSTVDYYGKAIDTTVHFRFMERANRVLIANFLIYMPYQSEKLQARFKYVQKQDDNRMKYSFVDQTNAENIIGWHWDFGDGTISNSQNAVHTYHIFGLYKISLTVTAVVNNELKTSIISKQLYISDQDYYHLGGHVFSEYFPIDMGYAYLYMIDSHERYIAIDTIAFDTLGYYFFYQMPSGKYMVKAEPMYESQYYGTLLPTYYGDKIFWEESVTISLTSTSWEYNINLGHAEGVSGGEGSISGNIIYDNLPRLLGNLSAEGVNIYLFDEYDKLLTCHYSDNLGDFSFDQVELNSYKLYPEITGIEAEKV